jgi:hypothetical protein
MVKVTCQDRRFTLITLIIRVNYPKEDDEVT